ncbi:hypothetical protein RND81_12G100500 [Saponaria officinalis]|uniref:Uncharacterized protein n=1 Tax=Saponaria officinalis TaxID=3572 RepID=A0AAW1H8S9_SAPOF
MWDLTPDTDFLSELPDDYMFETALADLIDNSLQAVWSNGKDERKLISIEIDHDRVSVFDTGPGMDGSEENSIAKWGKLGASVHRSSKKLAIGGKPPFLRPFFGMFGYGGTIASMHLGRHAVVSAKTKESKKVFWLRLERDALLKRAGSSSLINWKVPGGIRDPTDDELEMSEHGSFLKVEMVPKLKVPDISQLLGKLKDLYFPYIQCDEISGRTATLVEFQVNGVNLAEIDGGEVAITNTHSCNGPEFVLNIHFSTEEDKAADKCQSKKEANARLRCVYFPMIEGKENIERILDNLNANGCGIKEDFQTFSRISIRRLGRLLPDARWELLPFMKPKKKRGDKLQILKRCCLRVKCFIDAGFNPIPSKTDLALHHPFTKALKELGGDLPLKGLKFQISRDGKQLSLLQLEREYQNWILQMHSDYDEEFNCGDDEPTILINGANKEELGITSDVVRIHQAVTWKGKSWKRGQKIKILKGAGPGCHKTNIYATIEYFVLENLQGDAGGEARVICRPKEVHVQDGAKLTDGALELRSSISLSITVIAPGKCLALSNEDWNEQVEKLNLKSPSIEVLGLKQCKALDVDGALPSGAIVSAGFVPPKEVVAVLHPSNFISSSSADNLDQKYIIKENHEMRMDVSFKADVEESSTADHIFTTIVTNASRRGCQGLYIFPLSSIRHLFQKAGVYSFSFLLKRSAVTSCEISVQVKASSKIERWKLLKDDYSLPFDVSVGSFFPPFSVARYDKYDNCVPFNSVPDIVFKLISDKVVLSSVKPAKVEMSSDQLHIIVRNLRVMTDSLDKIRPSYKATLVLTERDKSSILTIPCRVLPGAPKSVTVHLPKSGIRWLPKQVVDDIKLEFFDRHNNHVKEGVEIELDVHGFCFQDLCGKAHQVDDQGFVDLSGVLKVSVGYGKLVSFSVLVNKQVLQVKKFQVEKRELRMATMVPEVCHAGSKLKDIVFEVIDPDGVTDQNIHDDNKHGRPHTLKLRTGLPDNDSSRYSFRNGRCTVPSITLPKQKGDFFIEAVHFQHPELHLKFKVTVSQATDAVHDITSDLEASEENDDVIYQSSNERITPDLEALEENDDVIYQSSNKRITPDPFSPAKVDMSTRNRSNVQVYDQEHRQECAFSSPCRTPDSKKTPEQFVGNFTDRPRTTLSTKAAASTETMLSEKQPTLTQTPKKHYEDHIFQSQESKITCDDPFTPDCATKSMKFEFEDLMDVEKDICLYGSRIKDHEDRLGYFESRKNVIEDLVRKDHEELLQLQVSMEPVPLAVSYYVSLKEAVVEKIENKVESAAALYSIVSKDTSLRDRHSIFLSDIVGLVALIGSAPTHTLSRTLAEYLGEEQMLAVVCRSNAAITTPEMYELELNALAAELGTCIKGGHLFICLNDIREFAGGFVEGDCQERLALPKLMLPDGTTPPGFLGFAVNMIDIEAKYLQTKTSSGHGLRETLFYLLFGELQVYETKEDMKQAYRSGCATNGAVSLDGGILRGNGMISLGCREMDVHFPVIAEKNQIVPFSETVGTMEQLEDIAKKKQQQIEENKAELTLVKEMIDYLSQQRSEDLEQFKDRKATYLKLVEAKKESFLQRCSQNLS